MPVDQWAGKLDRFSKLTAYIDNTNLISDLEFEYHLSPEQVVEVQKVLKNEQVHYFRISCSKYEHFKIEPVYLSIKNIKGKLIYWKDWDYIFQKIGDDYHLWCYLGGIADIQREIKLSEEQISKYNELGLAQIDYLIADLKRLNDSIEYPLAIGDNRRIS
ncbi:hypothetical protein D3C87_94620 [compost metagenome]